MVSEKGVGLRKVSKKYIIRIKNGIIVTIILT